MSYRSLISCTERGCTCVATKMRSAYSSVSRREISFSRIWSDGCGAPLKGVSTPVSDLRLILHDRGQHGPRRARLVGEREVEQPRVRLLPEEEDRAVHVLHLHVHVCEVRELRRALRERADVAHEDVPAPAHGGYVPRHLLENGLPVDGLECVKREEGEERVLTARQAVLHVAPLQVRVDVRALHVQGVLAPLERPEGRRLVHADVLGERVDESSPPRTDRERTRLNSSHQ